MQLSFYEAPTTHQWWGNSLMKLRTRVRSVKETKNTSQWLPEPKKHDSPVASGVERQNAIQKGFQFWCFLVQWSVGTFFGSHFSVRLQWRIVFIGSDSHFEVFLVFLTDRTLARKSLTRFPTTQQLNSQQWQRTARAPLPLRPL